MGPCGGARSNDNWSGGIFKVIRSLRPTMIRLATHGSTQMMTMMQHDRDDADDDGHNDGCSGHDDHGLGGDSAAADDDDHGEEQEEDVKEQ